MSLDISWAWTMILIIEYSENQDIELLSIGIIMEKVVREVAWVF